MKLPLFVANIVLITFCFNLQTEIWLKQRVYSPEGIATIVQTRVILDFPAFASKIKTPGGSLVKVAVTEYQKFKKATKIPFLSLKDVLVKS